MLLYVVRLMFSSIGSPVERLKVSVVLRVLLVGRVHVWQSGRLWSMFSASVGSRDRTQVTVFAKQVLLPTEPLLVLIGIFKRRQKYICYCFVLLKFISWTRPLKEAETSLQSTQIKGVCHQPSNIKYFYAV